MIDNIILVITGVNHDRDTAELMEKCHPLGMFDSMATLSVATSPSELYRMVLVDTPLGQYFGDCLSLDDLDEMNIEIIRNTLYKAYLEDFYQFCQKVGGSTAEVMSDILMLEADRRAINITVNSIDTDLDMKQRESLYPTVRSRAPQPRPPSLDYSLASPSPRAMSPTTPRRRVPCLLHVRRSDYCIRRGLLAWRARRTSMAYAAPSTPTQTTAACSPSLQGSRRRSRSKTNSLSLR